MALRTAWEPPKRHEDGSEDGGEEEPRRLVEVGAYGALEEVDVHKAEVGREVDHTLDVPKGAVPRLRSVNGRVLDDDRARMPKDAAEQAESA